MHIFLLIATEIKAQHKHIILQYALLTSFLSLPNCFNNTSGHNNIGLLCLDKCLKVIFEEF